MRLRKRRAESAAEPARAASPPPAPEPAAQPDAAPRAQYAADTTASAEPVIEGEAVELPPEGGAGAGPAFAGGGSAGSSRVDGGPDGAGPSWPQPVAELADQRPEALVGAAFVGGILLAAILRRLGR